MELFCKVCGSPVNGEYLRIGHLERNVYSCTNRHCERASLHYLKDNASLPSWIRLNLQEYKKAN